MSDTVALNKPQVGDIVDGKYKLTRVLGEGGFGLVFQAEHLVLEDLFAIKFYWPKGGMHGPKEKERFLLEGRALRRIKSEYSVHVSDMGYFYKYSGGDKVPYIAMEFLEGTDLHDYVGKHEPLDIAAGVDFILQACIALAKAHAMHIIHRDLKPSNLFLTEQDGVPRVKVIDFGLAKDASPTRAPTGKQPQTESFVIIGTPAYMPPEQWRGLNKATHVADIFALGVSLYFLLTVHEPFSGDEQAEVNANVLTQLPTPIRSFRSEICPELSAVIERALQRKPEDRYPSIIEFARALVPFGDVRASQRMEAIERAAEAGEREAKRTKVPLDPIRAPPPAPQETATRRFMRLTKSLLGLRGGTMPLESPRQTNTRLVVVVSAALIVFAAIGGAVFGKVFFQEPAVEPNASATLSATNAPSAGPQLPTIPASSTSTASSAPTASASQQPSARPSSGRPTVTKPTGNNPR